MELFVGKKIELLREDGGMSQGELAKVLGVTRQTVSKWEADVCRPKVKVLQALCGLFGVDMSYFTGVEVSPQQIGTLGEFIRKLRRRAKLSQEQFAERMGVSRRMISLWETGEVKPRAGMLQKLGECFCMDEEERQQLQRLAAAERAQSPAAGEGAEGRALADAAEGACGQNAAESRTGEFAARQGAEDRLAACAAFGSVYRGCAAFCPARGRSAHCGVGGIAGRRRGLRRPQSAAQTLDGGGGAFCRHAAGHRGGCDIDLHILCAARGRSDSAIDFLGIDVPRGNCPRIHRRCALVGGRRRAHGAFTEK